MLISRWLRVKSLVVSERGGSKRTFYAAALVWVLAAVVRKASPFIGRSAGQKPRQREARLCFRHVSCGSVLRRPSFVRRPSGRGGKNLRSDGSRRLAGLRRSLGLLGAGGRRGITKAHNPNGLEQQNCWRDRDAQFPAGTGADVMISPNNDRERARVRSERPGA